MSKKTTDQKTEKQTATEPVVLNDRELCEVAGGAPALPPSRAGQRRGTEQQPGTLKGTLIDLP